MGQSSVIQSCSICVRLSSMLALTLAIPRLVLLTAVELIALGTCCLAHSGADASTPPASWRRAVLAAIIPSCTRVALLCVGFWVCI